jgi:diguanylate cyclase (GGDEF)-like protein
LAEATSALKAARLWIIGLLLAAATAAIWFFALGSTQVHASATTSLPWWALAVGFAVAEACVVQVRVRGSPYDVGLVEAVLVLGLFSVRPELVLLAQAVGGGVALLARGQQPGKLAFNLGRIAVATAAGLAVFGPLSGSAGVDDPRAWGAALLAALVTGAVSFLAIAAAVRLVEGPVSRTEAGITAGVGLASAVVATGLGLAVVAVVARRPVAGVFFVPVAVALLGVRIAQQRSAGTANATATLASLTRAAGRAGDEQSAANAVLVPVLRTAGARSAELLLAPIVDGEPARALRVSGGRTGTLVEVAEDDPVLAAAEAVRASMLVSREAYADTPPEVRRYLADRGWIDAVLCPVGLAGRRGGLLVAGGRSGAAAFGRAEVETVAVAAQAAGTIEAGRMQRSLASMVGRQADLEHRAYHDGLSGLANRPLFLDRVGQALARRLDPEGGDRLAVLLVDLDNLKLVNDSLGHQAGDQLLIVAAERIESGARVGDTAARLSGDEFAVLLPRVADAEQAMLVARRLLDILQQPLFMEGHQVPVSASVGVAVVTPMSVDASELVRRADVAMYAAKRGGKGRCELYDDRLASMRSERPAFGAALSGAAQRGEVELHYQPYVELATGLVAGYEALVRWRHPRHGLVMPAQFMSEAIESGAITEIGAHVLATACQQLVDWERDGLAHGTLINVNVSGREIVDPGFLRVVVDALAAARLPPSRLVLEVAERTLAEDFSAVIDQLDAVAEQGVRWTVDDFGTGLSNLSALQRAPLSALKIPAEIAAGIGGAEAWAQDRRGEAVLAMAQSLRLVVHAESVEHPDAARRLLAAGCTYAQGAFFGPPQDADRTAETMRRHPGDGGPARLRVL